MIQTNDLTYYYQNDKVFKFPDIKVNGGEALLILGQSGIGKTTLLHLLGGLMNPISGKILVNDQDITQLSNQNLDKFRGQNISIVFQKNHFIASLNVLENLELSQELSGEKFDKNIAFDYLEALGIKDKKSQYTNQLSEGEKQRVAIVRALINTPKLILADEPTSALDDNNAKEVAKLLVEQSKSVGAALLIVTHDARLKAFIDHSITLS